MATELLRHQRLLGGYMSQWFIDLSVYNPMRDLTVTVSLTDICP